MENIYQRNLPTDLELNGPFISFTEQPVGVGSTVTGSVTLSGIATVSWGSTEPSSIGTISYQWYEDGIGALSDSATVTGSATTTLTISDLRSPQDNGRQFYLEADYNATDEYQTALKGTGNAPNEPKKSNTVAITVEPLIEIIAEPATTETVINTTKTFTVDAGLTDSSYGDVTYQWSLNGNVVNDGTVTDNIGGEVLVDGPQSFTFTSDECLELIDARDITIVTSAGTGGAGVDGGSTVNGGGGRTGRMSYAPGQTLNTTLCFKIGRGGNPGSGTDGGLGGASSYAKGGDGGPGPHGGGGGGGATAVYDEELGRYTIVAAGGGGGGGSGSSGPPNGRHAGLGYGRARAAMTAGTSSPADGTDGSNNGGGGGAGVVPTGYPAVNQGGNNADGNSGASGYDENRASFAYDGWQNYSGNGYVSIEYTGKTKESQIVTRNTVVKGSKTNTLSLSTNQVGIQTVSVSIVSADATNSPLISTTANFVVRDNASEYLVTIEGVNSTSTANVSTIDLFNGEFQFTTSTGDPTKSAFISEYVFHAPDKDINVEMDLYGAKGVDVGSNSGGEGGFSRVRFTLDRNVEYTLAGLIDSINAPYLYRKSTLIASVGQGGAAGTRSSGGFGGGIGVSGSDGSGGASGGAKVDEGALPSNGTYGSLVNGFLTAVTPDTNATGNDGGRTIPCTRGEYWRQQNVAACDDVTTESYRLSDGTLVTNTSSTIARGYKAGYNIIQTAGLQSNDGGNGGNGTTGGAGGANGFGGGGGSGYTDGSVTVVSTQSGGSDKANALVVMRLVT